MLNLELKPLLELEATDDWIQHNALRTSSSISGGEGTLVKLLEFLGPVLTHTKPQVRCGGLLFLTSTLESLPGTFLQQDEVGLLVSFYTDRLRDHHSIIPQTLKGLLYMTKCENLTRDQLEILLDSLFRELMVQQQVVRDRAVVFNIIAFILFQRFEFAKTLETQLVVGFLQAGEGEKDPRNLMMIYKCTSFILERFQIAHLREDIFESLAVYFPIDFTPPKGINATVTKEDLISSLRTGLTHPGLAEFSISLFMEKLESDLESAKLDSVESLSELVTRCTAVPGGKEPWIKDKGKFLELVWTGLKKELLGIRLQAGEPVLKKIRDLISQISYFVEAEMFGLRTPGEVECWRLWFGWILADVRPHLSVPGTRLIARSLEILAAVAVSGKVQSREVLSSCLPLLLGSWRSADQEARNQLISSVDQLLEAAADAGLRVDGDVPGFDELVGLYLETGNLQGLAKAGGLLNNKLRGELVESMLASVDAKTAGPAIVQFARWESGLVERRILPACLNMGDRGLPLIADLMKAELLHHTLLPVSAGVRQSTYSSTSVHTYLGKLADYGFTQQDRDNLSGQVGEILKNLLSWLDRPTNLADRCEEREKTYCTVINKLAALVGPDQLHVISDLGLLQMISQAENNQGTLREVEAVVSSLPKQTLVLSSGLIDKVLELPGSWELKGSLVNKLPELADRLAQVVHTQGVGQICHALVLRGDQRSAEWLKRLLDLLENEEKGSEATACFLYLLSPAPWLHPSTSLLFKQRAWSTLHPSLLAAAKSPEKIHHLSALISLLPQVPLPLLEPVVPALLPLVTRALGQGVTAPPALSCLNQLISSSPGLISTHVLDIVPRCLKLSLLPLPLNTRLQALVCLRNIGQMNNPQTISTADSVISHLSSSIQDHKRLVRQEATRARNRWYLLTQP